MPRSRGRSGQPRRFASDDAAAGLAAQIATLPAPVGSRAPRGARGGPDRDVAGAANEHTKRAAVKAGRRGRRAIGTNGSGDRPALRRSAARSRRFHCVMVRAAAGSEACARAHDPFRAPTFGDRSLDGGRTLSCDARGAANFEVSKENPSGDQAAAAVSGRWSPETFRRLIGAAITLGKSDPSSPTDMQPAPGSVRSRVVSGTVLLSRPGTCCRPIPSRRTDRAARGTVDHLQHHGFHPGTGEPRTERRGSRCPAS